MKTKILIIALLLISTVYAGTSRYDPQKTYGGGGSWPYKAEYTTYTYDSKTGQYDLIFEIYDSSGNIKGKSTTYYFSYEPLQALDNRIDSELWIQYASDVGGFDNAFLNIFKQRYDSSYSYGGACWQ